MKPVYFLFFSLLILLSCKSKTTADNAPETKEETKLSTDLQHYEDEIMKIHDEVMPKMSDIQRLSQKLRDIKSKAGQTENETPVKIEGLDETLQSLREAEQGMSDWMKNYSDTKAAVTPDLLRTFYERELEKITIVKNNMLNSIDKANSWLAQHPEYK